MLETQRTVSIILPTHNGEKFLKKSIESCLHQTYPYFELIIVNDGSVDGTRHIMESFHDERIKCIHLTENAGIVKALNTGFSSAKGDFLTWTSDDNYYANNAIGYMLNYLNNNVQYDFVYAKYNVINEKGDVVGKGHVGPPEELDFDNYVGGCFLFRRNVYEKVGDFHQEAFLVEDYEYWLRVRQSFKMKILNVYLYYYRQHDQSLTAHYTEQKVQEQVEKIREKYVSEGRMFYFKAKKAFLNKDFFHAKKFIQKSIIKDPFFYESWRILGLLAFPEKWIKILRSIFKKNKE